MNNNQLKMLKALKEDVLTHPEGFDMRYSTRCFLCRIEKLTTEGRDGFNSRSHIDLGVRFHLFPNGSVFPIYPNDSMFSSMPENPHTPGTLAYAQEAVRVRIDPLIKAAEVEAKTPPESTSTPVEEKELVCQ